MVRKGVDGKVMTLRGAQARLDRAQGMYPVVREDAAQMAALQMQAEHGPALAEDPEAFEASLEKVLTKQARPNVWHLMTIAPSKFALDIKILASTNTSSS